MISRGDSVDEIVYAQQQLDPAFDINTNGEAIGEKQDLYDDSESQVNIGNRVSKRLVKSKTQVKVPR